MEMKGSQQSTEAEPPLPPSEGGRRAGVAATLAALIGRARGRVALAGAKVAAPAGWPLATGRNRLIALVLVLVLLPVAVGAAAHVLLRGVHRPVETLLAAGAGGRAEFVTALAWSPGADDTLFVGTGAGRVLKLAADGTREGEAPTASGAILRIQPLSAGEHFDLFDATASTESSRNLLLRHIAEDGSADQRAFVVDRGLFAVADDAARTRVTGSAARVLQAQQSKAPADGSGPIQHDLVAWRSDQNMTATIGSSEPRVVVAVPGRGSIVAGFADGSVQELALVSGVPGQVFSQQAQPSAWRPVVTEVGSMLPDPQWNADGGLFVQPDIVVLAVAAPADGSTVVAAGLADGNLDFWRRPTGSDSWTIEPAFTAYAPTHVWTSADPVRTDLTIAFAMSGDFSQIAGVNQRGRIVVQSLDGSVADWEPRAPDAQDVPDYAGGTVAAFCVDGVMVWLSGRLDLFGRDGTFHRSFGAGASPIRVAAFSPDCGRIAAAREDGALEFFEVATGELTGNGRPRRQAIWDRRGELFSAREPS